MKEIICNTTYTVNTCVDETKLACNVGSGSVNVYATPMMIALMENCCATCLEQFLDEGETSVGVMINTTHSAATPLGMNVEASCEIIAVDRKKVTFKVIAKDEKDTIGEATHERVIVAKDKFESRALAKSEK